jgi:hypothetical protein
MKIIKEQWAATAQEEAEKIKAQTGVRYHSDQAYWELNDIVTGEDLALDILSQAYSDMYKGINGIRPRWKVFSTPEEAQAEIDALDVEYERMRDDQELDAYKKMEYEEKQELIKALGVQAMDYDEVPKRQGMGNRPRGKKAQRQWEGKKLVTTKKRLSQIIKEVSQEINEMPVSTARGYGSQNFDKRYPHLVELANQIDALASQYGFDDANIEKFDSGIVGISIDLWGDKTELVVVDQPGKTGLEDHSLAFISYGKYPEAAHGKAPGGIYFKPEDRGRYMGDTAIRQPDRERVYAQILADLEKKFSAAETGTGRIYGEADTKKYDDDSALKGKQSELPDELQKGIIDKTVEDREEDEKKDEGFRILNKMIMQEIAPRMKGSGNEHPAIGQWDTNDPSDPLQIAIALRNTWDEVRIDVGISRPTAQEMGEEASYMLSTYYPDEAAAFNALSLDKQDGILAKAFGR